MNKIRINKNFHDAAECEGHLDLVFDLNTTNVEEVVYGIVITKDKVEHPFTLLVTDKAKVETTIDELKQSYYDNFAEIKILKRTLL